MKNTLYNIKEDYAVLMETIEENEGVLTDEQVEQLEINKEQLESKAVAYLEVIKKSEGFIALADDELKRLQAVKKRNKALVDTLKSNLLNAVQLFGDFQVGTLTFGTRKSEAVLVEDVNSLPAEFKTIKVTESANKADLKAAIKGGKEIDGVILQTNLNLKIK